MFTGCMRSRMVGPNFIVILSSPGTRTRISEGDASLLKIPVCCMLRVDIFSVGSGRYFLLVVKMTISLLASCCDSRNECLPTHPASRQNAVAPVYVDPFDVSATSVFCIVSVGSIRRANEHGYFTTSG
ncbi:unnamed protein product [Ectocarpus sp. 12 AP-2014]